jgi:D-alanyl-D-alanine-carboxypeptidase/D-alanyl-D-alanine-endopeptidase
MLAAAHPFQLSPRARYGGRGCPPVNAATIVLPTSGEIQNIVQQYVPPASNPNVGVAVGLASPAFGTSIGCYGSLVDQNGNPMSFSTDTPFEIASITKTFVATAYALLLGDGRADASAVIGPLLPQQVDSKIAQISLRDLADYTSGLPEDNKTAGSTLPSSYSPGDYTETSVLNFLADPFAMNSSFALITPGTQYVYSNLAFSLLAFALQTAAASDFAQLMAKDILTPVGMMKTQPYVGSLDQLLPAGFESSGAQVSPGWALFPGYYGAGGLVSTPNDMMTWLQLNMGILQIDRISRLLPRMQAPAAVGAKKFPSDTTTGLGWFLSRMSTGKGGELEVVWKDGDLGGFSSYMIFLPRTGCAPSQAGVFVLVNKNAPSSSPQTYSNSIAVDLLFLMSGIEPPSDKSRYPHSTV